jgi:hypothetical protein
VTCFDRVAVHIADQDEEIGLILDPLRRVTALEQIAIAPVSSIEVHAIEGSDALHHGRQRAISRLDDQMKMVALERPSKAAATRFSQDPRQPIETGVSIEVVEEKVPTLDSSSEDVMNRPRCVHSRLASHGRSAGQAGPE